MKLQQLTLDNFMIHRSLQLRWSSTSPLVLVCGPNEAGKSAIAEALDFVLRGDCYRLESKGARRQLITEGAKKGAVTLVVDDAVLGRNVADGKVSASSGDFAAAIGNPDLVQFFLNHQAFSRLDPDARRRALYSALQVGTSVSDVTVLLAKRGHSAERIALVASALGSGFEAALKVAKARVSDARGAWQEVTGETYGAVKAEGWRPSLAGALVGAEDELAELTSRREALLERRDALIAERQAITDADRHEAGLESSATRARNMLTELGCPVGREFSAWLQELAEYVRLSSEAAGAARAREAALDAELAALPADSTMPVVLACPCCASGLVLVGGALVPYVPGDRVDNSAKRQQLREQRDAFHAEALREQQGADTAQAKLDAAQPLVADVHRMLAWLDEQSEKPTRRSVEQVSAEIAEINQSGTAIALRLNELRAMLEARDSADAKAERAAALHADLQAWSALAEALEPSGIQAELLAGALKPFNDRLLASAQATGWPVVQLTSDMVLFYGQRLIGLASESGRWRADLMLTEALLFLGGCRSLVIDRFDVLDLRSRSACLRWLHGLAQRGELESALVLGTLKEAPRLPATYDVIWLGEQPAQTPGA